MQPRPPTLAVQFWVFTGYFLTAELSIQLSLQSIGTAIVWPSAGISFAAWLLYSHRIWPALALGSLLANTHFVWAYHPSGGQLLGAISLVSVGNLLAPWVGAKCFERFQSEEALFEDYHFVLRFVLAGALPAAAVAALVGAGAISLLFFGGTGFLTYWLQWGISDLVGVLLVSPLVLLWATNPPKLARGKRLAEALLVTMLIVLLGFYVFGPMWSEIHLFSEPFLLILPLLWAAMRFSLLATLLWNAQAFVMVWLFTSWSYGHFHLEGLTQPITSAQWFIGLISVTSLMFGASVGQLRRLKQELQLANRDLESRVTLRTQELTEANQAKDRFFGIISHDLRGPIGNLHFIFNDVLQRPEDLDEELLTLTKETTRNTYRMLTDLLDWALRQSGHLEPESTRFDLAAPLREMYDLLFPQAQQKQLTIELNLWPGLTLYADRAMVTTVIRNLLSNAIKFSPVGGEITVNAQPQGEEVKFWITDQGQGISPSLKAKLFRLGENIPSTEGTNAEKGTGLGLLFCHEFISKNKGKIGVESEPGQGSRFWFTLPKVMDPQAIPGAETKPSAF